jgi:accessory gene regulator protein AgrB
MTCAGTILVEVSTFYATKLANFKIKKSESLPKLISLCIFFIKMLMIRINCINAFLWKSFSIWSYAPSFMKKNTLLYLEADLVERRKERTLIFRGLRRMRSKKL